MSAPSALAATLVEPGRYELREYPLPEPAPGCLLVQMQVSGICGTDKHTYQGFTGQYGGDGAPRHVPFPIIQGHENVGTIEAIGGNGRFADFESVPLQVGDRVIVGPNVSCGTCYYCRYYCCENTVDYGNNISAKDPPHLFGGWSLVSLRGAGELCGARSGRVAIGCRGSHRDHGGDRGTGSRQANFRVSQRVVSL